MTLADKYRKLVQEGWNTVRDKLGLEERTAQKKMMDSIVESVISHYIEGKPQTLAVEAPTGTGKTFAYIIPLLAALKLGIIDRAVVSTATNALAQQVAEKDFVRVLSTLGMSDEINLFVLKGSKNYVCVPKLQNVEEIFGIVQNEYPPEVHSIIMAEIENVRKRNWMMEKIEFSELKSIGHGKLRKYISCSRRKGSERCSVCAVNLSLHNAQTSKKAFIVTNHHYLYYSGGWRSPKRGNSLVPSIEAIQSPRERHKRKQRGEETLRAVVVCDEAHGVARVVDTTQELYLNADYTIKQIEQLMNARMRILELFEEIDGIRLFREVPDAVQAMYATHLDNTKAAEEVLKGQFSLKIGKALLEVWYRMLPADKKQNGDVLVTVLCAAEVFREIIDRSEKYLKEKLKEADSLLPALLKKVQDGSIRQENLLDNPVVSILFNREVIEKKKDVHRWRNWTEYVRAVAPSWSSSGLSQEMDELVKNYNPSKEKEFFTLNCPEHVGGVTLGLLFMGDVWSYMSKEEARLNGWKEAQAVVNKLLQADAHGDGMLKIILLDHARRTGMTINELQDKLRELGKYIDRIVKITGVERGERERWLNNYFSFSEKLRTFTKKFRECVLLERNVSASPFSADVFSLDTLRSGGRALRCDTVYVPLPRKGMGAYAASLKFYLSNPQVLPVLCSATLSLSSDPRKSDFSLVKRFFRVKTKEITREFTALATGGGFNYQDRAKAFAVISPALAELDYGRPETVEKAVREIADFMKYAVPKIPGGSLVLCTNVEQMYVLGEELRKSFKAEGISIPVKTQFDERVSKLLSWMRTGREDPRVLIGLNTLWEGIDLPGEALRGLFMIKTPFSNPHSFSEKMKSLLYSRYLKNASYFDDIALPSTLI